MQRLQRTAGVSNTDAVRTFENDEAGALAFCLEK